MTRSCSVSNCRSGRYADRRARKLKNIPNLSIFQVPRCSLRRKIWMDALHQELSEKDMVCELHFAEDDIIKHIYVGPLSVGIDRIPTLRWKLRPLAVPMSVSDSAKTIEQQNYTQPEMHSTEIKTEIDECPTEVQTLKDDRSLQGIIAHFQVAMPQGWLYYQKPPDVVFVFCDIKDLTPIIQLRCPPDGKAMISFQQRPEFSMDVIVECVEDVYEVMSEATRKILCNGTDVDDRFAEDCIGIVEDKDYQRMPKFPRCRSCSNLRKQLLLRKKSNKTKYVTIEMFHNDEESCDEG